ALTMNKSKKIVFGKISANFAEKSTPIEATGAFGTFGTDAQKSIQIEALEDDMEQHKMKEVMGITQFGKKAKSFNIKEMMAEVTKTARELSKNSTQTDSTGQTRSEEESDDDDDDIIGPG
ncbi:hypothetical protein AMK59_5053, partial [Oryctes borbonicus]